MGWKKFKEFFNIDHIVHISNGSLCIGSMLCPEIVKIDLKTGKISGYNSFLNKTYPQVLDASSEEILSLLDDKDIFKISIPVYSYKNGVLVEDFVEDEAFNNGVLLEEVAELRHPLVTHKGVQTYENTHFKTKEEALVQAIRDSANAKSFFESQIQIKENEISHFKEELRRHEDILWKLQGNENDK